MEHRRRLVALSAGLMLALLGAYPASAAGPVDPAHHLAADETRRIDPAHRQGVMAPMSFGGADGQIAYSRGPYNEWPDQIWAQDLDGGGLTKLTFGTVGQGDHSPAWSPGGTLIAFSRDQTASTTDDSDDIYVMNADGSGLKRLTSTSAAEYAPNFSPDGGRLVFSSNRAGNFEIYTMKIDGSDVRRLTNNAGEDYQPNWSPDSNRIAFSSNRAGNFEIYTMNPDGSGVTRLTTNAGDDYAPNWSPDGTKIAFASDRAGYDDIFVMNETGSGVVNLTNDQFNYDSRPSWSPDGTWIIYETDAYGDLDVEAMTSDGTDLGAIAYTYDDKYNPDWQPIPAFPLVDAQFSSFYADILWLYDSGITSGCSDERFCPDDPVTRGQMAAFLDRAFHLPSTATDYFTDDDGTTFEGNINRLAASGITKGCSPTLFCPTDHVTRGQMAAFLDRAFGLPVTATDSFTDDDGTTFEGNINRLAASGITKGCGPTTYCPTAEVTRGQMAAFLHRALTAYPVALLVTRAE